MLAKFLPKLKINIRNTAPYMQIIKRVLLLCYLLSLLFRGYSNNLPFQMEQPAYKVSGGDYLMAAYNFLGVDYFVFGNQTFAILFTCLLFLFLILAFIFINKKGFAIAFYVLYVIYALGFNSNMGYPASNLKGLIIFGAVFFVRDKLNFNYLWEALRYYACWLYFSAFIWKILNRAFFMERFGEMTFKDNLSWFIYVNPDHFLSSVYLWLIAHPWLLNIGDKLVFLFEGMYIIGFITKKYDRFLGWGIIILHLFLYFVSDTLFAEIYVLALAFVSVKQWRKLTEMFPFLSWKFNRFSFKNLK